MRSHAPMLNAPPREPEWRSWLVVALWSLLIFVTIPLAPAIQQHVQRWWGPELFSYVVLAAVAAGAAVGMRVLGRMGPSSPARYLWLLAVGLVFAGYTWALRGNPEEAVHFVEYGVLGILLYRALLHRGRDASIYAAAAFLAASIGTVDEAIQWLTPERYWDLRDVWLNFSGAALALLGIAAGLRPPVVAGRIGPASVRRLALIAALLVMLIGVSLLNTPPRIAWYTSALPWLAFARSTTDVMMEYGHLYDDPDVGRFRSRFAPEDLVAIDAARAHEAGAILRAFAGEERYPEFLARYTPVTDPFVHEARVHLFRRDRFASFAGLHPEDPEWYPWHVTVAHRENLILERWFPRTLDAAGARLPPEQRATLARDERRDLRYDSRVSEDLITSVSERQVGVALMLVLAGLMIGARAAGVAARRRV